MTALAEKNCVPCRGGVPPLTREEAERLHEQAPDWTLLDDARRIERISYEEMLEMAEPAFGSDMEKAPKNSPLAMRGR